MRVLGDTTKEYVAAWRGMFLIKLLRLREEAQEMADRLYGDEEAVWMEIVADLKSAERKAKP